MKDVKRTMKKQIIESSKNYNVVIVGGKDK